MSDHLLNGPNATEHEETSDQSTHEPVRDDTERAGREQEWDDPATDTPVDQLLLAVTRDLVGASSRTEIERTVCERLTRAGPYRSAWTGERKFEEGFVPRVTVGDARPIERPVPVGCESDPVPVKALRACEVQVAAEGVSNDREPAEPGAIGKERRSIIAVPLHHGETVYGVLVVSATRADVLPRRERVAFEALGEIVGFAIRSVKRDKLLFADTVLELEFRVTDAGLFLARDSERFDCELSVNGAVATTSGGWLLYVAVQGTSPTGVSEAADTTDSVESVRVVRDTTDGCLLEYRLDESSFLREVASAGGKLRSADAAGGVGRVVIEAPRSTDVREMIGRIRETHPHATLLAKRERDRSVTGAVVPDGPLGGLTDSQRQALEAAFRAGYFEWPRDSSAEEVAALLDISRPTFQAHLRKAENELLSAFFDTE